MIYVREYSWMWDKLGLSLAECRIYAYIYGLTHGEKGGYDGSKRHLAELLGLNAGTVKRLLDTLTEKHLIVCTDGLWQSVATNNTVDVVSNNENVATDNENVASNNSPHTPLLFNNNINKDCLSRNRAQKNNFEDLLKKNYYLIDMETIGEAIRRKDSMAVIWALLNPAPEYRELYNDFMRYWNRIERQRQLQIWYFLKRKIDHKQPLDPNPLEAVKNCWAHPINYNGSSSCNDMIRSPVKMVKAFYNGHYGIYERMDAQLYNMSRITPLN